jgi:hypothetical protein
VKAVLREANLAILHGAFDIRWLSEAGVCRLKFFGAHLACASPWYLAGRGYRSLPRELRPAVRRCQIICPRDYEGGPGRPPVERLPPGLYAARPARRGFHNRCLDEGRQRLREPLRPCSCRPRIGMRQRDGEGPRPGRSKA